MTLSKQMLLIMIFMAAAIIMAADSLAEIPDAASIQATLINQEPSPVEPGEHLIVRFRIENLGSTPAHDVRFELLPDFPFSVPASESPIRELGTIAGRQKDKIGVTLTYDLIVDSRASEGVNEISAKYITSEGLEARTTYNISVRARQSVIGISSVSPEPEQVIPGGSMNVTLLLENNARNSLRDIRVKLDMSSPSTPFAPLKDAEEKSLSQMSSGQKEPFSFKLVALPGASAGVYKIPVTLIYSDQIGKNFTRDDLISLTIGGKPSIVALLSEQDALKEGKPGSVTVQVINNGLISVKLATIELGSSGAYEIISAPTAYIGGIDSDDFDTAKYMIYVRKATKTDHKKEISLPVTISYMDANNNRYKETFELKPRVYTGGEASDYGLEKKSSTGLMIITAIVISGLFIYSKFFRNKQ